MGCGASATAGRDHKTEKEARRKRRREAKEHRRQVLQRLRESGCVEHLLENPHVRDRIELLADMPVPVIIWSGAVLVNDGVLLYANLAAEKLFEHDQQSLKVGNCLRKIIDAEQSSINKLDDIVYKTVENLHGRKADGTTFTMSAYTTILTSTEGCEGIEHAAYATILQGANAVPDDTGSFGSFSCRGAKLSMNFSERRSSSQFDSPPLSPRSTSPNFERKLNVIGDILIVATPTGKVNLLSDAAKSVFGDLDLKSLSSFDDLLHEKELKSMFPLLDNDDVFDRRFLFKGCDDTDKQEMCILQIASRIVFPDGNIALRFVVPPKRRQVGFVRKKVADEVALLLDVLPSPAILAGKRGDIRYCNPAAEQLLGWSNNEMQSLNVSALIPYPFHSIHEDLANINVRRFFGKNRPAVARNLDTGSVFPLVVNINEYVSGAKEAPMYFCELRPVDRNVLARRHQDMLDAADGVHPAHPLPSTVRVASSVGSSTRPVSPIIVA